MLSSPLFCLVSLFVVLVESNVYIESPVTTGNGFDLSLYEDVLDSEECVRQISFMSTNNSMLLFRFVDAGPRTPRGIFNGNFIDLGSYNECLGISYQEEDMSIEGKYCMMRIPVNINQGNDPPETEPRLQTVSGQWIKWTKLNTQKLFEDIKNLEEQNIEKLKALENAGIALTGRRQEILVSRETEEAPGIGFNLAICIPKVCSLQQALNVLAQQNITEELGISQGFCRLPDDRPWVAADSVAVILFSIIGLLTILSTAYDIWHAVLQRKDPKEANKTYLLFSVYTNTRNFFTFRDNPNAIQCLDGIRSLAMMWVIVGHTFAQFGFLVANPLALFEFVTEFTTVWISSAPITVDTFFMLSGLLLVYTTAHKLSAVSLLKNLHFFYLNRLLRMFPVLATGILLQASFYNRISDGPVWTSVVQFTTDCRDYWWTTLLYVQNYVNPLHQCLPHAWYLAIDMQLYILSPIVLFWMLTGNKKAGWIAIIGVIIAVLAAATTWNFIMEFPASTFTLARPEDSEYYVQYYYMNTLTRAAPFLVGMIFGYIMHLYRGTTVIMPKILVAVLWLLAFGVSASIIITPYYVMQADWDNQTVDSILNSFMRPVWAACVGWMIFACKHGYGGPIDWFLSLHIFKILGRLSYAMYIMHYCLQNIVSATALAPMYFSTEYAFHRFFTDLSLAVISALLVMVLIDAPCTGIIGMVLGGVDKSKEKPLKKGGDLNNNSRTNGILLENTNGTVSSDIKTKIPE